MTFEAIEKCVIGDLKGRIISGSGANMDSVRTLIARRKDGHWANPMLALGNDSTRALVASYVALEAAASFFELQSAHSKGFSFADASAAFDAYSGGLFKFDQLYRAFMRAAESVEPMGWSLLHELRDRIEDAYSGWFIGQLSSAWGAQALDHAHNPVRNIQPDQRLFLGRARRKDQGRGVALDGAHRFGIQ